MVQEILAHNGDVLKFAGDAFLSMWKKTARQSMQDVVHNAIDCGLIIQKNYGTFKTDIGVVLKGWLLCSCSYHGRIKNQFFGQV